MKAEDTVMVGELKAPYIFTNKRNYRTPWSIAEKVAKAQAPISFKAGQKEVVEWLKSCMLIEHCDTITDDVYCRDYRVYMGEWQAKLKEWDYE